MKITSKSILSPGRDHHHHHHPPNSLSTSLSRRLKHSGSIRGGASPAMFPTAKKRGTFENPEPSSPKVTCIGQVRVRGKKNKAKKLRTLSRRHSAGDVSFMKLEHTLDGFCSKDRNNKESLDLGLNNGLGHGKSGNHANQDYSHVQRSWVHFPVTVCEALRAFGSEFSCLIPCKTERGKEEKNGSSNNNNNGNNGNNDNGSCGAVFTRWLVAVQDGEGGSERDIEMVVGDDEVEEEEEESDVWRPRRHVFEDLEIVDGRIEGHEDEARVSVCVPPKNALLLMRSRSEPIKNDALGSNKSWEPTTVVTNEEEEEEEEFVDCENHMEKDLSLSLASVEVEPQQQVVFLDQDQENVQQVEASQVQEVDNVQKYEVGQDQEVDNVQIYEVGQNQEIDNEQKYEASQDQELDNVEKYEVGQDQEHNNEQKYEASQDQEFDDVHKDEVGQDQEFDDVHKHEVGQDQQVDNVQNYEVGQDQEIDDVQKNEVFQDQKLDNVQKYEVGQDQELDNVQKYEVGQDQEDEQREVEEESFNLVSLFEETMNEDYEIQVLDDVYEEDAAETGANESTMVTKFAESETEEVLPQCLLLMMNEPKLSIMVSKETWVCSADFIRRPSNRRKPPPPPVKPECGDESTLNNEKMVVEGGFPAVLQQPARSSCSLPVAPPMATVLEHKLRDAVGHEPFVLTRCKSEPIKTAAAKLLPESCVWENRRVEWLSRGSLRVGAAGLGF